VAAGVVVAVGLLVLAAWLFDILALKSVLPGLAGISLWLASSESENQRIDLIAKACTRRSAISTQLQEIWGGVKLRGRITIDERDY
jgi:hypothetical protein